MKHRTMPEGVYYLKGFPNRLASPTYSVESALPCEPALTAFILSCLEVDLCLLAPVFFHECRTLNLLGTNTMVLFSDEVFFFLN